MLDFRVSITSIDSLPDWWTAHKRVDVLQQVIHQVVELVNLFVAHGRQCQQL